MNSHQGPDLAEADTNSNSMTLDHMDSVVKLSKSKP